MGLVRATYLESGAELGEPKVFANEARDTLVPGVEAKRASQAATTGIQDLHLVAESAQDGLVGRAPDNGVLVAMGVDHGAASTRTRGAGVSQRG